MWETEVCAIILSVLNTVYNCLDNSQSAGREHHPQGQTLHTHLQNGWQLICISTACGSGRSPGKGNSNILAWETPWTVEFGRLQSMGLGRVRHDWATNTFSFHFYILSVNIGVHVFVHIFLFLFCTYLGVELLGHMITLFNCLRNCQTLFLSDYLEIVAFSFPACSVLGF